MQIEPFIATLRTNADLSKLVLDGRPVLDAIDEIAIVGVEGEHSDVHPVARNAAAARLLAEPGMTESVRGVLQLNASRDHGSDLQTLLLPVGRPNDPIQFDADTDIWSDQDAPIWDTFAASSRRAGFVAGKVAIALHQLVGDATPAEAADLLDPEMPELVEQLRVQLDSAKTNQLWAGQASKGVMLLSPEVADGWRTLVRAGQHPDWKPSKSARLTSASTLSTVFHELEHVRSFPDAKNSTYHRWLKEGTANVLADWKSEQKNLAQSAQVPAGTWDDDPDHEYAVFAEIVERLLTAAGIDQNQLGSKTAADALLQRPELAEVPDVLAHAIARNLDRGDDPGYVARIRHAIENGRGTKSHLRHIERVIERA